MYFSPFPALREGDRGEGATPWWFPSETNAGAMAEGRIVLPIPPGVRWPDEMPVIVRPEVAPVEKQIVDKSQTANKAKPNTPTPALSVAATGGIRFGPPAVALPVPPGAVEKKT